MSDIPTVDCEGVLRDMFAWLDGELGETRNREIRVHLDRCISCFSRSAFEARLKAHLREVGHAEVPPEVERRIRAVLARLPSR